MRGAIHRPAKRRRFAMAAAASSSGQPAPVENGRAVREAHPGLSVERSEEGVGGKYSCSECRGRVFRDKFLIEAMNSEGKLDPGMDWQGGLFGRCYECCCGRGPNRSVDIFEDKADTSKEETMGRVFKKVCLQRHAMRTDIKQADLRRLRTRCFHDLMMEVAKEHEGKSRTAIRKMIRLFVSEVCEDVTESFAKRGLTDRLRKILRSYAKIKEQEATGDLEGIVVPGGQLAEQTQWLSDFSDDSSRFFICRNKDCSPQGSFFGPNIYWISTVPNGGWHFMCPVCAQWYQTGRSNHNTIPAHHIWYRKRTNLLLLRSWAASAEEDAIGKIMACMSRVDTEKFTSMNCEDLMEWITLMIKKNAHPKIMKKMVLSEDVKAHVEQENSKRTSKKKWSIAPCETGFTGSFYKFTAESGIMKETDTNKAHGGCDQGAHGEQRASHAQDA